MYILGLPATAECSFISNILDINEIGYFGIFQTNSFVDAGRLQRFPSLWTECQI